MKARQRLRIGNASGYWGDDLTAFGRQLSGGKLDYLTLDFLAEVTMSVLQKQRARNPDLGYAVDFLELIHESLPLLKANGTKVITNAGGLNPLGCAQKVAEIAAELKLKTRIAAVDGDDLMDRLDELLHKGISLTNLDTQEDFSQVRDQVQSANAYLGSHAIARALEKGAEVVVTGRVIDAGMVVAPPLFEFGWDPENWNRIASALVAGHILECGAQASGGNLTDWEEVPSFLEMGYPIGEMYSDGSFHVTKPEDSGGLVNLKTVTEQLVYEIGDPRAYYTPDAIIDFTSVSLSSEGDNRVGVSGVRGRPPTDQLKVSISYQDGFMAHGTLIVSRPQALTKCQWIADCFWNRLGIDFQEVSAEMVGYNACHRHLVPPVDPPEILLRLGAKDPSKGKIEAFAKQFTSLLLSTAPGVAMVGSRPRIQEVIAYWPTLVPKYEVTPRVVLIHPRRVFQVPSLGPPQAQELRESAPGPSRPEEAGEAIGPTVSAVLLDLCYARSGDKGNICNVGIVARSETVYQWLRGTLTAEKVKEYFGELCRGEVERFELPNLLAFNFLLHDALGGGGTSSLRIDPQGKTLAQALLMMRLEVPLAARDSVPE